VGGLGLFAALGLEWAGLYHLRRSTAMGQVRDWVRLLSAPRFVGGPAALTILATGIYMSIVRWGQQAWIGAAFLGVILMAVLGAVLGGGQLRRIGQALRGVEGPVPEVLEQRIRDPLLVASAWLRTGLALGIVFLMVTKPAGPASLAVLGAAVALGLMAGLPAGGYRRRALHM